MSDPYKRSAPRKRVMIPVIVGDRNWSNTVHCLICDASRSGCRLKSDRLNDIPDEIYVKVGNIDQPIKGQVVWRKGVMAGVQFSWGARPADYGQPESKQNSDVWAVISDREGKHSVECVVKSANGDGCMVVAEKLAELPNEISIKFEIADAVIEGNIIWRSGAMAGVEFVWEAAAKQDQDDDQPGPTVSDVPVFV